ncbi:MAG: ornithine carbamoyltransferase, partial [Phycisphaerae bacterium]|nr:ornithine carbamoyltransferase [Phycisphaerae bacterium]
MSDLPKSLLPEPLRNLRHFLSIADLSRETFAALLDFCIERKQQFKAGRLQPRFQGRVLAMIFQKPSLRTRLGFEAAMAQLGGHAVNLEDHQVGLMRREATCDVARVISGMADIIMARVYGHQTVVELAATATVPVINSLSDWAHPCQALADLMAIREHFGRLEGLSVAYVGDANNVARSLSLACAKMGLSFRIASPVGYQLDRGVAEQARGLAAMTGASVLMTDDPVKAVADADVVYTDAWTSMGQEGEEAERARVFANYQVNAELMRHAKSTAV